VAKIVHVNACNASTVAVPLLGKTVNCVLWMELFHQMYILFLKVAHKKVNVRNSLRYRL